MAQCTVCNDADGQYRCPRCDIRYCGVACFRGHSNDCVSAFEVRQMELYLRGERPSDEEQVAFGQMLQRIRGAGDESPLIYPVDDEHSSSSEDEPNEEEVLTRIAKMTVEERTDFQVALRDGRLAGALAPDWTPWWVRKVQVVDADKLSSRGVPIMDALSPKAWSKAGPAKYQLVNVFYGFAATTRLFHGDWDADPESSGQELLRISEASRGIPSTATFGSVESALTACMGTLANETREFRLECLLNDVLELLSNPERIQRASREVCIRVHRGRVGRLAARKLAFLDAWVRSDAAKRKPTAPNSAHSLVTTRDESHWADRLRDEVELLLEMHRAGPR